MNGTPPSGIVNEAARPKTNEKLKVSCNPPEDVQNRQMSRSCATTAGANRNNAMAAIHFCITNNEFPALPSYRRKHCLPIGRRTRGTGTGSSRAGFAGIWAAGAAPGSGAAYYVLLLATFAHWHASCHGYESVAHAENHASRQRPGVPAQTRRPAIGTLGSRTRT